MREKSTGGERLARAGLAGSAISLAQHAARLDTIRWPEQHVERAVRLGGLLDLLAPTAGESAMTLAPTALAAAVAAAALLAVLSSH